MTAANSPKTGFRFKKDHYGYLFIAPFIIAFLLFGLYPVYNTFRLSFTNTTLMGGEGSFVGLQNYDALVCHSPVHEGYWQYLAALDFEFPSSNWYCSVAFCLVHEHPVENQSSGHLANYLLLAKSADAGRDRRLVFQPVLLLWPCQSRLGSLRRASGTGAVAAESDRCPRSGRSSFSGGCGLARRSFSSWPA